MNNKLTNAKALEMILTMVEVQGNAVLAEKVGKMLEQTKKKSNGVVEGGKLTKAQKENEEIKKEILAVLTVVPKSIKEIQSENLGLSTNYYSNQKMSALLKQLLVSELVVRTEEKRVAKFSIALASEILQLEAPKEVEEVQEVEFEEVQEVQEVEGIGKLEDFFSLASELI